LWFFDTDTGWCGWHGTGAFGSGFIVFAARSTKAIALAVWGRSGLCDFAELADFICRTIAICLTASLCGLFDTDTCWCGWHAIGSDAGAWEVCRRSVIIIATTTVGSGEVGFALVVLASFIAAAIFVCVAAFGAGRGWSVFANACWGRSDQSTAPGTIAVA
jgi:hypothetical protein